MWEKCEWIEVARWERWGNSEVAWSDRWEHNEVAIWQRWEGGEQRRWDGIYGQNCVVLLQRSEMQAGVHCRNFIIVI